jgi:hypothetical protein
MQTKSQWNAKYIWREPTLEETGNKVSDVHARVYARNTSAWIHLNSIGTVMLEKLTFSNKPFHEGFQPDYILFSQYWYYTHTAMLHCGQEALEIQSWWGLPTHDSNLPFKHRLFFSIFEAYLLVKPCLGHCVCEAEEIDAYGNWSIPRLRNGWFDSILLTRLPTVQIREVESHLNLNILRFSKKIMENRSWHRMEKLIWYDLMR